MNWREAYWRQAQSDIAIFKMLNVAKVPLCHRLHYLQMASEKLGKSYLYGPISPPVKTHFALISFLKLCKQRPEIRRRLNYGENHHAFVSFIDSLIPVATKIERLAPQGIGLETPNPEYPWRESASGFVVAPCDHDFTSLLSMDEIARFSRYLFEFLRAAQV